MEVDNKTKCVICWQVLGSKKQLLHGMKCLRFEIREKLKAFLHPLDFKTLYNESVFPEPRICNLCFVTIKQIPKGLNKLQDLLGMPINFKHYQPDRQGWDANVDDLEQPEASFHKSTSTSASQGHSSDTSKTIQKLTSSQRERCHKAMRSSSRSTKLIALTRKKTSVLSRCRSKLQRHTENQGSPHLSSAEPEKTEDAEETGYERQNEAKEENLIFQHLVKDVLVEDNEMGAQLQQCLKRVKSDNIQENTFSRLTAGEMTKASFWQVSPVSSAATVASSQTGNTGCDNQALIETENFTQLTPTIDCNTLPIVEHKKERQRRITRSLFNSQPLTTIRSVTRSRSAQRQRNHDRTKCEMPVPVNRCLKYEKPITHEERDSSEADEIIDKTISSTSSLQHEPAVLPKRTFESVVTRSKNNDSLKDIKTESKKSKMRCDIKLQTSKCKKYSRTSKQEGLMKESNGTDRKSIVIPRSETLSKLSKHSQEKLQELGEKVKRYLSSREKSSPAMLMFKCPKEGCDHTYPLWRHLAIHIRYYHHDGAPLPKHEFAQKMSMLAENAALDEAAFPFKCGKRGCELIFSSEDNRLIHESVHSSDLTHICGYHDCGKGFKLRASLQVHFRTHTGERPYSCEVPDCGKSYKHRSDLTMHQRRHMGKKPHVCDEEGCGRAFTTSTELIDHKNTHSKDTTFCCELCGKQFVSKSGLNSHQRKMHGTGKPGRYKCTVQGCSSTFVRKEKYELHLCSHSPERVLFCEKCGKQFGCQRYLDVHYKVHEKNTKNALHPPERTVACEVSGCGKMFTCRMYMKRHVISYHMGRRPRPVPGVFFACTVEGCGKKFSLKSTLCRHNLLVHKGGDYKLHRTVVKYPCTYSGCDKVFNRKNLLEKHMVKEHGKVPKRLLTQQTRELDCMEKMCTRCGMVLTIAQLSHHENIYHSSNTNQDLKESSPYPCHLEGCDMEFRTQAEREAHVQNHIEKPPYRCEVEECKETFFLLKNLDNHLWNHSKKASTCDVDGCSLTFSDQLQLAKHSKVHYDGRMKCPWRNCGNWFTAMGTLKQHFLAHSRSLKANFGWDFVCNKCDRVFSSKYGLKNHKRTHEENNSAKIYNSKTAEFVCEEPGCKTKFSQHKDFFDHFLYHYTNSPTACGFEGCTETFPTMFLQSKHGKSHYGGKYMCPWQDCDKMFASSFFQVKKHVYRHLLSIPAIAADRQNSCSQCDMVFRIQSNLTNHEAQHSEKSDYVCTVCGKKFHHNHLKRHMLTHRQEKPHACSHCGLRFGTVNGLKFHVLQKHKIGKWPFKCSYCGKGFISSTELRRHLPSHTKEKPFSCELCGDTFATHTGYKGHMRKHAGHKYVCDVEGCGKIYTTPLSMRGHKAQHAGFSKMCPYCGKTYKNPYGHKCKASRDAKQKGSKEGPLKPSQAGMASTTTAVTVPAPPSVITHVQHAVIITPTVITHGTEIQQADRNTMVPSIVQHSHFMPSTVTHSSIAQGQLQDIPQTLTHVLPNHGGMMQDTSQPISVDITRGTPINITGDYTFNNYVVFWDSQNLP